MRAPPAADRAPVPETRGTANEPAATRGPVATPWPAFDPDDLKRAQAGDPEALGRFFDHYCPRLFALAYRFTGSIEQSQDLTQEIFFKIRRHIGRLDLERDPAPWLYTVAIHACHDHRRSSWWKMSRHSVPLDGAGMERELPGHAASPEEALLAAEDGRRVHAAIARLRPDLRLSVILHDLEGLPHEQIADIQRISHVAARKRHSRALQALAALLREDA